MPLPKRPLRHEPLYRQAYEVLRRAILTGDLVPGERLAETDLAQRLGISRTPLREALRQLEAEGLLMPAAGGLAVARVDLPVVDQMYECRIALEKLAAAGAARRASPQDLTEMENALAAAREAMASGDKPRLLQDNVAFHRAVATASGNPWIRRLLEHLWSQMVLFRAQVLSDPADEAEVLQEHEAVLARIAAGDPDGAATAMALHLQGDLVRGRRALARHQAAHREV